MIFKPMLARNTQIKEIRLPTLVSNKMEGVRAEFTPVGLRARSGKMFNNRSLELLFGHLSNYCREMNVYVEGEFYIHGLPFNDISSICRRADHPDTDTMELHIFDWYSEDKKAMPFDERLAIAQAICFNMGQSHIRVAHHWRAETHFGIERAYEEAIEQGYEGLCFKAPNAPYKKGRSTHFEQKFLRIKPDLTYDGLVVDIVERLENLVESVENEMGYMSKRQDKDQKAHTGMAAVAIVDCADFPDPVRVVLSKNLTDSDRYEIWNNQESYIGKHLRFYGIPVAGMNQPRCPRFDCWRTDLD